MSPIFSQFVFWQPYFTLEPGVFNEADIAAQLDEIQADYFVRKENFQFEYMGRQISEIRRIVEIPYPCGDRFTLLIEYEPKVSGCNKTLFLADNLSGTKSQMGWWDLAQWHPYCLRQQELDLLLHYWQRWDPRWQGPEFPLLLFCQFVGLPDSKARDLLAARVLAALQTLTLPETVARQLAEGLYPPEEGYRWEKEKDLGWVFTSDEYCCYSIRNRTHLGSDKGNFPFHEFNEMMSEVRARLQTRNRR